MNYNIHRLIAQIIGGLLFCVICLIWLIPLGTYLFSEYTFLSLKHSFMITIGVSVAVMVNSLIWPISKYYKESLMLSRGSDKQ